MPVLIIENRGARQAGTLAGRVLIGRWPENTVIIDDANVSRIHAWIAQDNGQYYIADAGSRTGTKVNNDLLGERHYLRHNDEIRIGPAVLRYLGEERLPLGTPRIDLTPKSNAEMSRTRGGNFIDCSCGAPLWFPQNYSGTGKCIFCGQRVRPLIEAYTPPPTKAPAYQPPTPQPIDPVPELSESTLESDDEFDSMVDDALTRLDPLALADDGDYTSEAEVAVPPAVEEENSDRHDYQELTAEHPPELTDLDDLHAVESPAPEAPADSPEIEEPAIVDDPALEESSEPQALAAEETAAQHHHDDKERTCGVCHSTVTSYDETAVCPACGLLFHADCWQENLGCSSYGCSQVNALAPSEHRV